MAPRWPTATPRSRFAALRPHGRPQQARIPSARAGHTWPPRSNKAENCLTSPPRPWNCAPLESNKSIQDVRFVSHEQAARGVTWECSRCVPRDHEVLDPRSSRTYSDIRDSSSLVSWLNECFLQRGVCINLLHVNHFSKFVSHINEAWYLWFFSILIEKINKVCK